MTGSTSMFWGIIFGSFGLGFFSYGRKQQAIVPLCTGIGLFVFPYFIDNVYLLVAVGCGLIVLPFVVRL